MRAAVSISGLQTMDHEIQSAEDHGVSNGIRTNARFADGERVAGAVQGFVIGIVLFTETAKIFFAGPAVDGEVGVGDVSVTKKLSSTVCGGILEELGPGAARPISGLKSLDLFFGDFELPDHDEHAHSTTRLKIPVYSSKAGHKSNAGYKS
jgi:hypothetical protein